MFIALRMPQHFQPDDTLALCALIVAARGWLSQTRDDQHLLIACVAGERLSVVLECSVADRIVLGDGVVGVGATSLLDYQPIRGVVGERYLRANDLQGR